VMCCCLEERARSLWSRRYHWATGLSVDMRPGLAMLLGSHEVVVLEVHNDMGLGTISIHLSLGASSRWEHCKKGSDPLGGS
jgi:hypothetical protein